MQQAGGGRPEGGRRAPGSSQGQQLEEIGESRAREGGAGQGLHGSLAESFGILRQTSNFHFPRRHFLTTLLAKWTSWLFEMFFALSTDTRPIPQSVILDEAIIKISEERIYFSDVGQ